MQLAPHWKEPYEIAQFIDSCREQGLTYRIENPFDSGERVQVVHYNRLRPYTLPVSPLLQNQNKQNSHIKTESNKVCYIILVNVRNT